MYILHSKFNMVDISVVEDERTPSANTRKRIPRPMKISPMIRSTANTCLAVNTGLHAGICC